MGIDAQRSGASELPVRAVEVRRGRIAYPLPSGCPGTPWYARREFWAGQLAEKVHSSAQQDEGDPGVDRPERGSASWRSRATPESPAFWAVQPSPNGRWQSPARPMRPPGCGPLYFHHGLLSSPSCADLSVARRQAAYPIRVTRVDQVEVVLLVVADPDRQLVPLN